MRVRQVLWLKSASSEEWLDRRSTYTRSLAVMSMVGYVLGLGDRHPSNLMLHRVTGAVMHIDFGDCFEVRATRPTARSEGHAEHRSRIHICALRPPPAR